MTNDRAVDILRNAAWLGTHDEREQIEEAIDMAINALTKEAWKEEHPVSPLLQKLATNLQPSKQDDLISRQAASIALWKALHNYEDKAEKMFLESDDLNIEDWMSYRIFVQNMSDVDRQTILELPSAQPETHEERTETHGVCLDAIDRQAAIDAHYEYCNKHPDAGFPVWSLKILEDLPSAQPEIIRCKDCIFHGLCRTSPKWAVAPKDDWFCADAERRTDDR